MDYYEILSLPHDADDAQIKRAYFAAVKKHSPEHSPLEFKQVKKAYDTLSNTELRKEYDLVLLLPQHMHKVFLQASEMQKAGDLDAAIRLLESITKIRGGIAEITAKLGDLYLLNDNTGKASKLFKGLAKKDPENALYRAKLALAYHLRGWRVKASAEFEKAIRLGENNLEVVRLYVEFLLDIKETEEDLLKIFQYIDTALRLCGVQSNEQSDILIQRLLLSIANTNAPEIKQSIQLINDRIKKNAKIHEQTLQSLLKTVDLALAHDADSMAKHIVRNGILIFPDSHELQDLAADLKIYDDVDYLLTLIEDDENIPELIFDLLVAAVYLDYMDEAEKFVVEATIFEEIHLHKGALLYLKQHYPKAFALRASFFEDLLNPKKHSILGEKLYKKCKKYAPQLVADDDEDEDEDEINIPYVRDQSKVGRNDPCPCNSGKKYKKCCGK